MIQKQGLRFSSYQLGYGKFSVIIGCAAILISVAIFLIAQIKYSRAGTTGTPVVISSAGTLANPTFHSAQNQIFYDGARWWAFYMKSTTANTLFYSYSTDLSAWTESSVALGGTVSNDGGTVSVFYDSATGVVLVSYYTDTNNDRYMRGNISGTTITWSANTNYADTMAKNATGGYSYGPFKDFSGKVLFLGIDSYGNPRVQISTNTISTTFADSATNWTNLSGATASCYVNDYIHQSTIVPLDATQKFLIIGDDLNVNPQIVWYLYNAANCVGAGYNTLFNAAGASRTNWAVTKLSNTDVRFLGQNGASTFLYSTFNGTAWTTGTSPAWPTGGLATNSGVSLINDGTNVWAFVIRGDANETVSYNLYSAGAWGGWVDVTTTSATRSYIQIAQSVAGAKIAMLWTQTNGSNFDIVADSINTTYSQSAFRLFNNVDSTDVGTPLAAQDTAATLGVTGAAFRLRMLLLISNVQLAASAGTFKLQFATRSGTCDTAFSGETYSDVTASTTIAYNNNPGPADGVPLTANVNDPTHGTDTIVNQTYEELNNFINSVATINMAQDGKWDFSLKDNGAASSTAFCFRAVKSDGTVLDTYTVIPQITTASAAATVSCSTDISSTAFGTMDSSSVFTASSNASATISCSGTTAGCTLYVADAGSGASPGLYKSTTPTSLIVSADATLSAGTDGYGVQATSTAAGLTLNSKYNKSGNTVGGLLLTNTALASSTADIASSSVAVTHKAAVSANTLSGSYSDTIIYSCLVN